MNGSAPNCPPTGSQVDVKRKDHPDLWRETAEFTYSCSTNNAVISITLAAQTNVITYAASSPPRRRCARDCARPEGRALVAVAGGADMGSALLDFRDRLLLLGYHRLRQ